MTATPVRVPERAKQAGAPVVMIRSGPLGCWCSLKYMECSRCLPCARISPLRGEPLTGEPDAGESHVRFGGRGIRIQSFLPTPYLCVTSNPILPPSLTVNDLCAADLVGSGFTGPSLRATRNGTQLFASFKTIRSYITNGGLSGTNTFHYCENLIAHLMRNIFRVP